MAKPNTDKLISKAAGQFVQQLYGSQPTKRRSSLGTTAAILHMALEGTVPGQGRERLDYGDLMARIQSLAGGSVSTAEIVTWLNKNGIRSPGMDEVIERVALSYTEEFLTTHGISVKTLIRVLKLLLSGSLPGSDAHITYQEMVTAIALEATVPSRDVERWLARKGINKPKAHKPSV